MRKYQPSNRIPASSFLLLIIAGIIIGIGLGVALWAGSSLIQFLPIIIVILAGVIAGGILAFIVRVGKVRNPFVAALVGLLTGILLYVTYHYADYYITFRDEIRSVYVEDFGVAPPEDQFNSELDQWLEDQTGSTGFVGYMLLNAEFGLTLSNSPTSSTTSNIDLSGTGAWLYWGFELLLIVGFAVFLPVRATREPFDESSNEWYPKPEYLASASKDSRKALVNAFKDGDFMTAGGLLTTSDLKYPRMEIHFSRSADAENFSNDQRDVYVTVNHVQRKGRNNVVRRGVISPSEFSLLTQTMSQAARQPFQPI